MDKIRRLRLKLNQIDMKLSLGDFFGFLNGIIETPNGGTSYWSTNSLLVDQNGRTGRSGYCFTFQPTAQWLAHFQPEANRAAVFLIQSTD